MDAPLLQQTKEHWEQLRGRSYDLLKVLSEADLFKTLPFPESQSVYYQFRCMCGTTETFVDYIRVGKWEEWHCSLAAEPSGSGLIPSIIDHLKTSDKQLLCVLETAKLLEKQQDGLSPLQKYLTLVEHESHHHGQLINFMYALPLPIPKSWAKQWALER